ncbi:MAG: TIGR04211 family SH3 domain-containing protein [Methylococcales bacterium]
MSIESSRRLRIGSKKWLQLFATGLIAATTFSASATKYGYVTDQLDVHVRKGKSVEHRIVETISSGTQLILLTSDMKTGYSKVQLEDGSTGWLLNRFILNEPIARTKLVLATESLTKLETENKKLKEKLENIELASAKTQSENKSLVEQKDKAGKELTEISHTAVNAVTIKKQRDDLQGQVIQLKRAMETLKRDNQSLEGNNAQYWFFIGASVLFSGIALGLIIPRIGWRRKSSWDTL